ncbi:MAG: hypothetical protein HC890_04465 [Chloroflexaceae bacterium]|nr:hypothetical protein [Chloroflexaceae bacterium]
MVKISVSLPEDLVNYLDRYVANPDGLIETVLEEWRHKQEDETLAEACAIADELEMGWEEEWQTAAIMDWEALRVY